MAKKDGWVWSDNTLYEFGTELIEVGKNTIKQRIRKLSAMRNVDELPEIADNILNKEERKDLGPFPIYGLRDHENGIGFDQAITGYPPDYEFPISRHAYGQIINRSAANYLYNCPSWLRKTNFDHWADNCPEDGRTKEPKTLRFRTKLNKDGVRGIFAAISPRYQVFDLNDMCKWLANNSVVNKNGKVEVSYTGNTMWKVSITFFDRNYELAVGDISHGRLDVYGSDDGRIAIHCNGSLFRVRCLNASSNTAKIVGATTWHTQKDFNEVMTDNVNQAMASLSGFADAWKKANEQSIINKIYEGCEPERIFSELVKNGVVSVAGIAKESLIENLCTSWRMEPGYSKGSIVNAISRCAHEGPWSSPWVTSALEEEAGNLVYARVFLNELPPEPTIEPTPVNNTSTPNLLEVD
jgi:hypothetical protein